MTFSRPWFLLLLPLLGYFLYVGWPRGRYALARRRAALTLRGTLVLLLILALAGLQTVHGADTLGVVFLVDVSDSVSEAAQARALAFVEEALQAMRPMDRAALVLFGDDALVERPMLPGGPGATVGPVASVPRTQQTDLAQAIRVGTALFPPGAAKRLVLLSDGRPTVGDAEQAARLARAQGIALDVVPLTEEATAEAWVASVTAPERLRAGEHFSLQVEAQATRATTALLTVLSGDRVISQREVQLNPGANTFAVTLTADEPGFERFRAYLTPAEDTHVENNALAAFAVIEGAPTVLVVRPDPTDYQDGVDVARQLRAALEAGGLAVEVRPPGTLPGSPVGLADYAGVVLVDTPARMLAACAQEALQRYVRDLGGGLVAVGGPQAYGVGGWYETPLERTLPVKMTLDDPERFPAMSVVVVIDKSGSMGVEEGGIEKIRLAGEAAARVAELINDVDEITVIAFDDRPVDVIGPYAGTQRAEVINRVTRLQAGGGGIYVRESLETALAYLEPSDRKVRHIILLADGADAEHQEGVRALIEERLTPQQITLSTVAIGAGQDLQFLEEIAELGGGRYHFTDQAANLPAIFAEETQQVMRAYVVEEPFYPTLRTDHAMLTGIEAVPQLAGYVATAPKAAAQVLLTTHQEDPLLATWQYGLGRAVAWTSDATARWAQRWVTWDGFPRFWSQVVRWTLPQQSDAPVEVAVTREGRQARLTVDAVDAAGRFLNGLDLEARVVAPEGAAEQVTLSQVGPGRYAGTFTPAEPGAYLLRLTGTAEDGATLGLTTGWVAAYSEEYAAPGSDPAYLARLAALGGGRLLEAPEAAFDPTLEARGERRDLWPTLLAVAVCLLPVDVAVRRLALTRRDWARLRRWLAARVPRRRKRPREEAAAPSPVQRLFEAKSRVAEQQQGPRPSPVPREEACDQTSSSGPQAPPSFPPKTKPSQEVAAQADDEETLARRLLRRKQRREENER
ncbi:MAG: VWA domain-containing protein [Anaerolineae bacterium]